MYKEKPICIIPARGGSKRIKNKNLFKIGGKRLIEHAIHIAQKSKIFSKIVVSTDSKKIAEVAIKAGAKVPFLRQKKLSGSNVTIKDTLHDCIHRISSNNVEYHCCLLPAGILINPNDLKSAYLKARKNKLDAIFSAIENQTFFRSFIKNKKYVEFVWEKNSKKMSQQLRTAYSDSGSFYFFKTKKYLKSKKILLKKTSVYVLDKYVGIDVDDKKDLKFLKLAFKFKNQLYNGNK
jgi:CMP-N-acetylneuraminic acid synthetase